MFTAPGGRTALLDAVYIGLGPDKNAHTPDVPCSSSPTEATTIAFTTRQTIRNWLKESDCQLYAMGFLIIIWVEKRRSGYGWSLLSELVETTGAASSGIEADRFARYCVQELDGAAQPICPRI